MQFDMFEKNDAGLFVPANEIKTKGIYVLEHYRKGQLIDREELHNLVVNEGLNDMLNTYLNGGAQLASWYIGVFKGNYTPVATDTAATIAGNAVESGDYSGGARPQWTPAAPSGQQITNAASRASYTFNATVTIYGAFLCSSPTILGTSGKLLSAARFSTAKNVVNTDQILITYQFTASSA